MYKKVIPREFPQKWRFVPSTSSILTKLIEKAWVYGFGKPVYAAVLVLANKEIWKKNKITSRILPKIIEGGVPINLLKKKIPNTGANFVRGF